MISFVERCMRANFTVADRARIYARGRVMDDEVCQRHNCLKTVLEAADARAVEAERDWALLRAQKAEREKRRSAG